MIKLDETNYNLIEVGDYLYIPSEDRFNHDYNYPGDVFADFRNYRNKYYKVTKTPEQEFISYEQIGNVWVVQVEMQGEIRSMGMAWFTELFKKNSIVEDLYGR